MDKVTVEAALAEARKYVADHERLRGDPEQVAYQISRALLYATEEAGKMAVALEKARDQFLSYEKNHRTKANNAAARGEAGASNDAIEKANVNRDMAAMCDAVLSSYRKQGGGK